MQQQRQGDGSASGELGLLLAVPAVPPPTQQQQQGDASASVPQGSRPDASASGAPIAAYYQPPQPMPPPPGLDTIPTSVHHTREMFLRLSPVVKALCPRLGEGFFRPSNNPLVNTPSFVQWRTTTGCSGNGGTCLNTGSNFAVWCNSCGEPHERTFRKSKLCFWCTLAQNPPTEEGWYCHCEGALVQIFKQASVIIERVDPSQHRAHNSIFTLLSGMRADEFSQRKVQLTVPHVRDVLGASARPALMDNSASAGDDGSAPPPPRRPPPPAPPAPVQHDVGYSALHPNRFTRQLPDVALPDPAGWLRHPAPQVTLPAYYCTYCTVYCTQYVYCMYCTSTVQYVEHSTPGTILRTSISYNIVCI